MLLPQTRWVGWEDTSFDAQSLFSQLPPHASYRTAQRTSKRPRLASTSRLSSEIGGMNEGELSTGRISSRILDYESLIHACMRACYLPTDRIEQPNSTPLWPFLLAYTIDREGASPSRMQKTTRTNRQSPFLSDNRSAAKERKNHKSVTHNRSCLFPIRSRDSMQHSPSSPPPPSLSLTIKRSSKKKRRTLARWVFYGKKIK